MYTKHTNILRQLSAISISFSLRINKIKSLSCSHPPHYTLFNWKKEKCFNIRTERGGGKLTTDCMYSRYIIFISNWHLQTRCKFSQKLKKIKIIGIYTFLYTRRMRRSSFQNWESDKSCTLHSCLFLSRLCFL
jgi:hypothetical protein